MNNIVQLKEYRRRIDELTADALRDGLVPVEVALGDNDTQRCLRTLKAFAVGCIHVRSVSVDRHSTQRPLYFIGLREAIWLNRRILREEEVSATEASLRIDLIQMMENFDFTLMENRWHEVLCG